MSAPPDPSREVDDLLGALKPVDPPSDGRAQAERAFVNHAAEAKKPTASAWRTWSRWIEPIAVGLFVVLFVVWALKQVFGGP